MFALFLVISCGPSEKRDTRCQQVLGSQTHKSRCKVKYYTEGPGFSYFADDCVHGCGGSPCGAKWKTSSLGFDEEKCFCADSKYNGILPFDESNFTSKEEYIKFVEVCF
jgi:hypothetical protein